MIGSIPVSKCLAHDPKTPDGRLIEVLDSLGVFSISSFGVFSLGILFVFTLQALAEATAPSWGGGECFGEGNQSDGRCATWWRPLQKRGF